jgi:hypothetical protein
MHGMLNLHVNPRIGSWPSTGLSSEDISGCFALPLLWGHVSRVTQSRYVGYFEPSCFIKKGSCDNTSSAATTGSFWSAADIPMAELDDQNTVFPDGGT